MDESELLKQAGLHSDWVHEFVIESNKIDPQPGHADPGNPLYDTHREALVYCIRMASEDRYALPKSLHEMLLRDHPLAGVLRVNNKRVSVNNILLAVHVPHYMWKWNRAAQNVVDALRTDDDSIDPDDKINHLWDLHCEFENIHPYELYNGKVGRLLMVNHALLVDVDPWIIPCELGRDDYFNMIRHHPSSLWGSNPPETYGEDFTSV